jgi:purine-binding chemotaxis protein CheW
VSTAQDQEQLLTFFVAGAEYGVDILRVQEIRGWSQPMPLPRTPPFVKGVINIRGDIVPIADLRERLGLPPHDADATTAIVVLRIDHGDRSTVRGIVVDAMSDVTNVETSQIKPPPAVAEAAGFAAFARGIAIVDDKLITILDVDRVFPSTPPSEGHDAALAPQPAPAPTAARPL